MATVLSVTGNVLHSVRAGSVHSKALKCSFNFKHVSNPGESQWNY